MKYLSALYCSSPTRLKLISVKSETLDRGTIVQRSIIVLEPAEKSLNYLRAEIVCSLIREIILCPLLQIGLKTSAIKFFRQFKL